MITEPSLGPLVSLTHQDLTSGGSIQRLRSLFEPTKPEVLVMVPTHLFAENKMK